MAIKSNILEKMLLAYYAFKYRDNSFSVNSIKNNLSFILCTHANKQFISIYKHS